MKQGGVPLGQVGLLTDPSSAPFSDGLWEGVWNKVLERVITQLGDKRRQRLGIRDTGTTR